MSKSIIGWYLFALSAGLVSGLCFSRAQYYQGKIDARREMLVTLETAHKLVEKYSENCKEEEESQ